MIMDGGRCGAANGPPMPRVRGSTSRGRGWRSWPAQRTKAMNTELWPVASKKGFTLPTNCPASIPEGRLGTQPEVQSSFDRRRTGAMRTKLLPSTILAAAFAIALPCAVLAQAGGSGTTGSGTTGSGTTGSSSHALQDPRLLPHARA